MPCDSVTTQRVSEALAKAMPPVLLAALKAEGWTVDEEITGMIRASRYGSERLVWTAGKGVTVDARSEDRANNLISGLTQAYSRAAVSWAAQRAGFKVTAAAGNKMTLSR